MRSRWVWGGVASRRGWGPPGRGKRRGCFVPPGLARRRRGRGRWAGGTWRGRPGGGWAGRRRERLGFVFQSFNLLPELSAADNIALPLRLSGKRPRRAEVSRALERVGLAGRRRARPGELSGGQQQRVAIARALVGAPGVVFA